MIVFHTVNHVPTPTLPSSVPSIENKKAPQEASLDEHDAVEQGTKSVWTNGSIFILHLHRRWSGGVFPRELVGSLGCVCVQ